MKVLRDIDTALGSLYASGLYGDRYDIIRLDIKLRWDEEEIEKQEVAPVLMTPDDPNTPYSERKVQDSLEVSSKQTLEEFEGNGFTPEGPVGTEPNIPPGYKDKDYQKARYTKKENIKNSEFNKIRRVIKKQPWEYESINLSVVLDGQWERVGILESGDGYERQYTAVSDEEIRTMTDLLKKAIGFNQARGDQISVKHIQKDRSRQFEMENQVLIKSKLRQRVLLLILFALILFAVLFVLFHIIKKEVERRKKLREEKLLAQQRLMREAALKAIEEEGVELEMSLEEKARKEMLNNAIAMVKEQPKSVANLMRTWLSTDD